jgi:hypothetical protein
MEQDIITFIIADPKQSKFTEEFYDYRNFFAKANAVVIHDVAVFFLFYDMAKADFRFRIIIHAGIADQDKDSIGAQALNFYGEITDRRSFKELDIPFMSRKRALFVDTVSQKESLSRMIDDFKCYNTLIFNSPKRIDEVLNDLPVFSKAQIEGSGPGLKKGLDFAVLTALYEDEFQDIQRTLRSHG